jgi:hypothetical protein
MQAAQQRAMPWDDEMDRLWDTSEPAERPASVAAPNQARPRPARERAERVAAPRQGNRLLTLLFAVALVVVVFLAATAAFNWGRVRLDDLRYGRPRTTQLAAYVGHGDGDGLPTQLMAVNMNRRITIIEVPGGDPSRVRTIPGPYLVGKDEELTVATMRLLDVNGDSHPDLLLRVKNEELVYINDNGEFRLMTRAERPGVERSLGGGQ